MIPVQQAKSIIHQHLSPFSAVLMPLVKAQGKYLAADVCSLIDVPSFDNSAMDGYAFCYDAQRSSYKITQHIPAGTVSKEPLLPGEAARIFTGAPLPQGADTVIQQELVRLAEGYVQFNVNEVQKGNFVRYQGAQCKAGDVVAVAGTLVTPGLVGLLASVGIQQIAVAKTPSVAVVITGDELQMPGMPLEKGKIYDANGPALLAYLAQLGIATVGSYALPDEPKALLEATEYYLQTYDVVLFTGGISVGDYDYVQQTLLDRGVQPLFYKVKQKPGKPLFVGRKDEKWVFALPGNPASVLSCFVQYVKPTLLALMGQKPDFGPAAILPLQQDYRKKAGLTHFLKAVSDGQSVRLLDGQDSFNLQPFGTANCFVQIEEEAEFVAAGTPVPTYKW